MHDGRGLWTSLSFAQRFLLFSSLLLVIAWCLSWRPTVWESAIVLGIMLWNARWMYAYLRDCDRDQIRWPLLDALTLTLAAIVISAGACYVYYLGHQRTTGTVSAGSLGVFVNSAKQDLLSCLLTVVMVFIGMRLDFIRRLLQYALNKLLSLKHWRKDDAESASTASDAAGGANA
ncbi:MAG: hypothetical protein HRU15_11945 [Planctomycetes bacterium]|nr:hypothetical protein [Planctomycetota bacterium]